MTEVLTKLKMAMSAVNVNQTELAKLTNQKKANLSNKMKADNFRIKEYSELVNALGCTLEINIVLPNGKTI